MRARRFDGTNRTLKRHYFVGVLSVYVVEILEETSVRLFFSNNIGINFDIPITITVFEITITVIVVVVSCCRILLLTANAR